MKLIQYFFFPHMSLSETECRHLALFLPNVHLLQVLREPSVPAWARERFPGWRAVEDAQLSELIGSCYEEYRQFAQIHQEEALHASLSHQAILRESCESRILLERQLRGKRTEDPELRLRQLVEAATFLEMSLDLDDRERELHASFAHLENLEGEFREILGIGTEDEQEEDVFDPINIPLVADRAIPSFMLQRRIGSWFHLLSNRPPNGFPVFVAGSAEVVEELLEPLRAECDRDGKPLEILQATLASIPALDHLTPENFQDMWRELEVASTPGSFRDSMEELIRNPRNEALVEGLSASAAALHKRIEDFLSVSEIPARGRIDLTLTYVEGHHPDDLFRRIDKNAAAALGESFALHEAPAVFLCVA